MKIALILCAASLAGCGETPAGNSAAPAAAHASGPVWNAADACSILDKADVAAIVGLDIASAQLSLVHEASATDAATSECTYIGADDTSVVSLMTRYSPINDNTPEAIATARSTTAATMAAFTSTPLEDIPGLGKTAFLAPPIDQLNVFIDDARMVMVTVNKVPDGASGKDIAIALARKAGA